MTNKAKIFNIQRFSTYDGPGIRTVVFFCGCNLRCLWCHNPESVSMKNQIKFSPEQCIGCGLCADVCQQNAHLFDLIENERVHIYDREKCILCLDCTKTCYAEALLPVGREISVDELKKSILTDAEYYSASGGGVTFSGGEPMLQIDFLCEILRFCKENGIHTAVDTAGNVSYNNFEKILPWCDLILYDIKAYDDELHKKLTGVSNRLILENIKRLSKRGVDIFIRVPVIKGGNYEDMPNIIDFIKTLRVKKAEFLAYHELGVPKRKLLGIEKLNEGEDATFTAPNSDEIARLNEISTQRL